MSKTINLCIPRTKFVCAKPSPEYKYFESETRKSSERIPSTTCKFSQPNCITSWHECLSKRAKLEKLEEMLGFGIHL